MKFISPLSAKQFVIIILVAITGFVLLPDIYKWLWFFGCAAFAAWLPWAQVTPSAEEVVSRMNPVSTKPSPRSEMSSLSELLVVGCYDPKIKKLKLHPNLVRYMLGSIDPWIDSKTHEAIPLTTWFKFTHWIKASEQDKLWRPTMTCEVRTGIFIDGLPESEYRRQQALALRPLIPSDIPNEPWRQQYELYFLRTDGAIIVNGMSVPLGFVTKDGSVNWTVFYG